MTSADIGTLQSNFTYNGLFLSGSDIYFTNGTAYIRGHMAYTYDTEGKLTTQALTTSSNSNSSIATTSLNLGYDNDQLMTSNGNLTITRSPSSGLPTQTVVGSSKDIYTYSNYGEVATYSSQYTGSPASTLFSQTLTRDNFGRITQNVDVVGSTSNTYNYTYDSVGRLTDVSTNNVSTGHYTYDSNSNRNGGYNTAGTITATYDAQDRILTYNSLTFTHNANGERITKVDSSTTPSKTTSYSYDTFGNLTAVSLPTKSVTYLVDGMGRRVGKKSGSTIQAYWIYDDKNRIVAQMSSAGAISEYFVYGVKNNVPEYMIKSSTKYRLVSDQNGSVRLVVNTSNGTISEQLTYDEFGQVLSDSSPGFQPFGFAGGLYDTDTGLVHFGARDYDPVTGRWMSKDPTMLMGGDTNLYGYVANDPVNWVDPRGLWGVTIGAGIGGYLGGGYDISGGIYFGYQNGSFFGGVYGSGNTGFGYGGGASVQGTYYPDACSISGSSVNYNGNLGNYGGTRVTDPTTGQTTGYGGSYGVGSPRGGSITFGNTGTAGVSYGPSNGLSGGFSPIP